MVYGDTLMIYSTAAGGAFLFFAPKILGVKIFLVFDYDQKLFNNIVPSIVSFLQG